MAYIRGEAREQTTMFPVTLDELIPADHMCRVIEAFVDRLEMAALGFVRAEPAETGRPGYDPRDLLKLYLYGNLRQGRWCRRLVAGSLRNVGGRWPMGPLQPGQQMTNGGRARHKQARNKAGAGVGAIARTG